MKQSLALFCAVALLCVGLAACGTTGEADYSNTTLVGKVTAVNGTSVTLLLGSLSECQPDSPPNGGDAPDGTPPSGVPDGQLPTGGINDGFDAGQGTFVAGEQTVTLDLSGAVVYREADAETAEGTLSDLAVDDILVLEVGDGNAVTSLTIKRFGGMGGSFEGGGAVRQGTAANTITEAGTYTGGVYSSEDDDENALRIDGVTAVLEGISVEKTGGASSGTEDGDFYGMNAGLLATNGANVTIANARISTSAQNGNGVFSYGGGTTVTIRDSTITTAADHSGGLQTTGGGATYAENLTVSTTGNSSAAIRSDRGGGTVVVDGGTYETAGTGSPAVYSTADITVKNAILNAAASEAVVVEGQNSVTLENCDLTGKMYGTEHLHCVMLYQSMSGDAEEGTSSFTMTGGSLTSYSGDLFYVTNTSSVISLNHAELVLANGTLLTVAGNESSRGWGAAGSNGGQVAFTASDMTFTGDVTVDSISTLTFVLKDGATYSGTIRIVDSAAGGDSVENNAVVTVEEGCTWALTGDCTLTSLINHGNIQYNGHTITLADGTVLTG